MGVGVPAILYFNTEGTLATLQADTLRTVYLRATQSLSLGAVLTRVFIGVTVTSLDKMACNYFDMLEVGCLVASGSAGEVNARTHERTNARTHARTHAPKHSRSHAHTCPTHVHTVTFIQPHLAVILKNTIIRIFFIVF